MRRVIGAVGVALLLGAAAAAQQPGVPLKLRGFALNFTGVGAGRSGDLEISIDRWSSDAEREKLRGAMAAGGVTALTSAVAAVAPRVGVITTQRGGSLDLKFAREIGGTDGTRRIVLATDRVTAPKDAPKADTYDFLVIEVRLDKSGKGEARTAGPARLTYNKEAGALELDRYGVEPVWVKDLKVVPAASSGKP
jgi:hypothetical protein